MIYGLLKELVQLIFLDQRNDNKFLKFVATDGLVGHILISINTIISFHCI